MLHPDRWLLDNQDSLVPLSKWQRTVDIMARVFAAPAGFIVQHTPAGYQVVIASQQVDNPYSAGGVIPPDTNIFCKKVVETHSSLYVRNAPEDRLWDDNPEVANDGFRSYLGLPIFWPDGTPFGTICVMDFDRTDYQQEFVALMNELRDLVQADLELISQYQLICEFAITDELTGLLNRRGFNLVTGQRISLARRTETRLGMLFIDLDGLKKINDIHGHDAGDRALICLADAIRATVRESDIAARLGGDEFVLVVGVKNRGELKEVERRISAGYDCNGADFSIGAVLMDDYHKPVEYWVNRADKVMYRNKRRKHNGTSETS